MKKLGVEIEECWGVYLVCPIHMIAWEIMVQILTFSWGGGSGGSVLGLPGFLEVEKYWVGFICQGFGPVPCGTRF